MTKKRTLEQMIPDLVEHFNKYADTLDFNYKLYKILNGQLKEEVECSLRREILSESALCRALQRIPPINMSKKITDKLSTTYIDKPVRLTDNKTDQEILESIVRSSNLDATLLQAQRIYNGVGSFALEPYIDEGKHKLRVLAPHQFLPYSDDKRNPTKMTAFIKLLGKHVDHYGPVFDEFGTKIRDEHSREVKLFAVYTDSEFGIIDSSGGGVRRDIMAGMGITSTVNPFGKIPYIYKSKSALDLIPYPDQELYDMSILVPKLLTDLNYAVQFNSHSIIYTKNTDLTDQYLNPDTVINLGDSDPDGNDPEIGTIDPKIDIPQNLELIQFQVKGFLSSRGMASKVNMNAGTQSGISKYIDEADTTAEKKAQTEFFRCIEQELFELLYNIQQIWSRDNTVDENRMFTDKFVNTFRIQFAEMRVAKTDRQKLEEIALWRDQQLMSRKQAIRLLKPEFTDKQIEDWIKELDESLENEMEMSLGGFGLDRSPVSGQFQDGNQAAKNTTENMMKREQDRVTGE